MYMNECLRVICIQAYICRYMHTHTMVRMCVNVWTYMELGMYVKWRSLCIYLLVKVYKPLGRGKDTLGFTPSPQTLSVMSLTLILSNLELGKHPPWQGKTNPLVNIWQPWNQTPIRRRSP